MNRPENKSIAESLKKNQRQRAYRKNKRIVSLYLELPLAHDLEQRAKSLGYKRLSSYIKVLAQIEISGERMLLGQSEKIQQMILALYRIGNNINQLVKYCHIERGVDPERFRMLFELIAELEKQIIRIANSPIDLKKELKRYIQEYPESGQLLIESIHDYQEQIIKTK